MLDGTVGALFQVGDGKVKERIAVQRHILQNPAQANQQVIIDDVARARDGANQVQWRLFAKAAFKYETNLVLLLIGSGRNQRQNGFEQFVVLLTRDQPADGDQDVRFVGGDQPGCLPLDCIQFAKQSAVAVVHRQRAAQVVFLHGPTSDRLDTALQPRILVPQVGDSGGGIR